MKILSIISFLNSLKNAGQGRYIKNKDIVVSFNNASISLWNSLIDSYQANQAITDLLRPFKKTNPNPIDITEGKADLPNDYAYGTSFWVNKEGEEYTLDILRDSEYRSRKSSKLLPPTQDFPIGKIESDQVEISPKDIEGGFFVEYLKRPTDVQLVFTLSTDGRTEIIDEENSTDTEWSERALPELIKMMATTLGITLNDGWLTQYQQAKQ